MSLASSRAEEGCQISVPEILDSVQNRSCIILNLFFFFFCSHNRCSKNCLVLHLMQLIKTPSGDESSAGPAIQLQEAKYIQRLKTQKAIIYRGQLDIENTTGHKILVVHCSFPYLETGKKKKKREQSAYGCHFSPISLKEVHRHHLHYHFLYAGERK